MSPGALIEGEHSSLLELHHYPINNSLHGSSPTFLETTPHQMPPDQSSFEQEGNYEETIEIPNVPLSSSPPDFTSSSPRSNSSGEYDSNETSTSNSSLSNISSSSPLDLTTTEGFGQKLHQLLLEALRERELRDKTDFSFYSDSSVVQTPEISSVPHEKASLCQIDSSFGEISPISFDVPKIFISSQKSKTPPQYRIIKRALSNGLVKGENETLTKRQKQGMDVNIRTYDQIYARRTASLRRAESLKSVDSDGRQAPLVPTVPATPIPAKRHTAATLPVPIIAPPSDHVAKLPMSSETFAKIRLERLLQRETEGRMADGLLPGISIRPPPCKIQNRGECSPLDDDSKLSIEDDIRFDWEVAIGLGSKRRKTIVAWLLKVLPAKSTRVTGAIQSSPGSPSSLQSSGGTVCSSLSSDSSYFSTGDDLYDQLHGSAETRFHAVWMFLRFFFLTMPASFQKPCKDDSGNPNCSNLHRSTKALEQQGLGLISWDIAIACLSLSVKFHRDFLNPLVPVYAHEYVTLAPHTLSYEDLEAAHRDILSAFDYRLGITPQSVLDELWLALPSLRSLLDFQEGWKQATITAWSCLFNFLREPDVQRFPISILTSVSLMDGILKSLSDHYRSEFWSSDMFVDDGLGQPLDEGAFDTMDVYEKCKNRAREDAEGVFCDIQTLIGMTDVFKIMCYLFRQY